MESNDYNVAETLAREMKTPIEIGSEPAGNIKRIALPPGWSMAEKDDDQRLLKHPRRKVAKAAMRNLDSFTSYIKRHGHPDRTTIWCDADYTKGQLALTAIINDHGAGEDEPAWRDHRIQFEPEFAEEWKRWTSQNRKPLSQTEFATFIEDNLKDIAHAEGQPTGAQMLEMALTFEANQDMRFKSAIRLQNGGVQMQFVQDDDAQTIQRMQVFDRFSIGVPVFWNGAAYRIDARLRYRTPNGKLSFWFELIRADKVLEDAALGLIDKLKEQVDCPIYFGELNG